MRSPVKTGAAIYDANQITAAKVTRNSQVPWISITNVQALPRCQRTFRTRISLVENRWMQCDSNLTTSNSASANIPSADSDSNPTLMTTPHHHAADALPLFITMPSSLPPSRNPCA
ncbi:unnamed protein product [Schistocephalus solidus]|uniref:Uncharacterized protein n=1 Tax=Schistocephalus solidus TaxID=70667 RepID=A0A183TKQ8_SCHSO|nr:unnamed protein product [Schistocephalus solidus]